jgi:hypothetical protein
MSFRKLSICLGGPILALALIWLWTPSRSMPVTLIHPPTASPLTTDELLALRDNALLERIQVECDRRVIMGMKGQLSGPEVLSPPACHLWTIASMEPGLLQVGFSLYLTHQRDPHLTPLSPTLSQLAAAYEGIGLSTVAHLVRQAVDADPEDETEIARLDRGFKTTVGTHTGNQRLAFALRERTRLFPE